MYISLSLFGKLFFILALCVFQSSIRIHFNKAKKLKQTVHPQITHTFIIFCFLLIMKCEKQLVYLYFPHMFRNVSAWG